MAKGGTVADGADRSIHEGRGKLPNTLRIFKVRKQEMVMTQAVIGKWGNNLAVRLPREIVQAIRLADGERVEIDTSEDTIIIRRARPRIDLAELFKGRTPEEWRAFYADAYDWGPDVGREAVPG
jgi:antitoxin component of MazEF toxin-antitoxin module